MNATATATATAERESKEVILSLPITYPEFKRAFDALREEGKTLIKIQDTSYALSTTRCISRSGIIRYGIIDMSDFTTIQKTLSGSFTFFRDRLNERVLDNKSFQTFLDALENKAYYAGMNEITFYNHLSALSPESIIRLASMMKKNLTAFQWSLYGKLFKEVVIIKKGDTLTLQVYGKVRDIPEDVKELAEKLIENK